ncbi:MAG: hypothetical protein M3275_00550 [Thermoproteota archaeon]|nr:hypothetical protein [Thermoproteota archaeon]
MSIIIKSTFDLSLYPVAFQKLGAIVSIGLLLCFLKKLANDDEHRDISFKKKKSSLADAAPNHCAKSVQKQASQLYFG